MTLPSNDPEPFIVKLPAERLPVTSKLTNVPVLVILGCALVVNVPVTDVKTPAVAPILPAERLPVTSKLTNVPVLVIFG